MVLSSLHCPKVLLPYITLHSGTQTLRGTKETFNNLLLKVPKYASIYIMQTSVHKHWLSYIVA